jgi:Putative peptidoglycan binding domain
MNIRRVFLLICAATLTLSGSDALAVPHAGGMMTGSAGMRAAPRFAPRSGMGMHRFDRDDRFHHFHDHTFIFIDSFGFPFFYPFPYYAYYPYGYYPYDYYGSGYYGGTAGEYSYDDPSRIAAIQRRLAHEGYYHGAIDGIMGPQTRRAMRAYERDHNVAG